MKKFTLNNNLIVLIVLMFALTLSACGQKNVKPAPEVSDMAEVAPVNDTQPAVEAMGSEEPLESAALEDTEMASMEGRTSNGMFPVYFDFDKSAVRPDQIERMEKNATFLKANTTVNVNIEGNCDERGTNEYNMALGERRAMSAKKYLVNLGVAANRMNTLSYGEERPINFGHDELSWSQNRRGDFVISK